MLGPKKFKIKKWDNPAKNDPNFQDEAWGIIKDAMDHIFAKKESSLSFEVLYRKAYFLVIHKQGQFLHDGAMARIKEHLKSVAAALPPPPMAALSSATRGEDAAGPSSLISRDDDQILGALADAWALFRSSLSTVGDILMYLDRTFSAERGLGSVRGNGTALFLEIVLGSVAPRVTRAALGLVARERAGEDVPRSVLRSVAEMLVELGAGASGGAARAGGGGGYGVASTLLAAPGAVSRPGEASPAPVTSSFSSSSSSAAVSSGTVYATLLETPLLDATRAFYRTESQSLVDTLSTVDYLHRVSVRLGEELSRATACFPSGTAARIRAEVLAACVGTHVPKIVRGGPGDGNSNNSTTAAGTSSGGSDPNSVPPAGGSSSSSSNTSATGGCGRMMREGRVTELSLAYGLLADCDPRTGALAELRRCMVDEVTAAGRALVEAAAGTEGTEPSAFVSSMIDLREKYTGMIANSFRGDRDFTISLNTAFETIVNGEPRTPEYMSIFADELLRRGQRTLSEDEVDTALARVVGLFRFLGDKDLFSRYYKGHLAKRLLAHRSVSEDAERSMISKLKLECGYHFTSKLEGMFNDMRLSADAALGFHRHISELPAASRPPIDLAVQVLTTGFWPCPSPPPPCVFPSEMAACCRSFEGYYLSAHTGRRLAWQPGMGTAELAASFGTVTYRVTVPTYAACVLVLFNGGTESLPYAEIARRTEIEPRELKRTLQTLACAKYRLLTKSPRGKEIGEADTFAFNATFTNKAINFKISNVVLRETEESRAVTMGRVDDDRKHVIEATIVRVMKSRKRLEHNNLVAEVTALLTSRFRPQPLIIKQRIESLIERDFLERAEDDRRVYLYKA